MSLGTGNAQNVAVSGAKAAINNTGLTVSSAGYVSSQARNVAPASDFAGLIILYAANNDYLLLNPEGSYSYLYHINKTSFDSELQIALAGLLNTDAGLTSANALAASTTSIQTMGPTISGSVYSGARYMAGTVGALMYCIANLKFRFPNAKIVVVGISDINVGIAYANAHGGYSGSQLPTAKTYTVAQFNAALSLLADIANTKFGGVRFLDLLSKLPWSSENNFENYAPCVSADNLHPNETGQAQIAAAMQAALEEMEWEE
jgi:hypothetical protein